MCVVEHIDIFRSTKLREMLKRETETRSEQASKRPDYLISTILHGASAVCFFSSIHIVDE